ncbi:Hypothetical predicted protein [Mytilus galloprovincialis]|uniref:Retrotransposon gag domain-containing protein n=1 Tax=Mytilus galloprovincialis TaxID=29158 RepID=A0A8B6CST8_MYTGA|nr:Hypothetical predicted protein [Mytilus galloprovincialis]
MEERFGRKEPPHIVRRLLQDLKQEQEESLEEFAERAQELATDGYPDTPDNFVQTLATDAFLKGCVDKRAALTAMDKNPDALDQAVQYVRSAVANQKVIMGTRRAEIKRVSFMEQNDENEDTQETSVQNSTIKLKEHLVLRGAGRNSKIDARYTEEIPIEIGKLKSKWRFVTANINDNIILGIDFLEKFGAVIDMANYTLST